MAGNGGGELVPASPGERRHAHAVEVAGCGFIGRVEIRVSIEPHHAQLGITQAGMDADAGVAVAGEHKREAAVAAAVGDGRGDAALDLERAADLPFKGVNRPDLDHTHVPIQGAQGVDQARAEQPVRPVADAAAARAGVERRDDDLDREHGAQERAGRPAAPPCSEVPGC